MYFLSSVFMTLMFLKANVDDFVRSGYTKKVQRWQKTTCSSFSQKQHRRSHPWYLTLQMRKGGGGRRESEKYSAHL